LERKGKITILIALLLLAAGFIAFTITKRSVDKHILSYTVDPKVQNIQFYWKNDNGLPLESIQNLKTYVEAKNQTLLFAMNGGMFMQGFAPQGLYKENHKALATLDTTSGNGNFYLKPNGVFYITTDHTPFVCRTVDFVDAAQIKYATQSGPMLVIDGQMHPAFKKGSANIHIRNGVGILPDGKVVFAMSKEKMNFYDFSEYFQSLGCKNALYLDGFVSRTYLPEQGWVQTDGSFGVMIGVTE
jgi:uncharacterized protein YigE (DUF2233 family)